MVERIRTLLQARQLTPTQFADAIGVARPIISHILSGRNKPSLEVVQKIIGAFPDLPLPWLLNGTGPMLAHSAAPDELQPSASLQQPIATAAAEGPLKRAKPAHATSPAPAEEPAYLPAQVVVPPIAAAAPPAAPVASPVVPPVASAAPVTAPPVAPPIQAPQPAPPAPPAAIAVEHTVAAFVEPGKRIKRIVIFYQDGTFGDFLPE